MIFCIPWHTRHGSLLFFSFGLILHIVKPSHCGLCEPQGELINSFRALPLRLWGTFVCVSKRWWSNCGGVSVTWSMVVSDFYDVWLYQYDAIVGHLLPYTIAHCGVTVGVGLQMASLRSQMLGEGSLSTGTF